MARRCLLEHNLQVVLGVTGDGTHDGWSFEGIYSASPMWFATCAAGPLHPPLFLSHTTYAMLLSIALPWHSMFNAGVQFCPELRADKRCERSGRYDLNSSYAIMAAASKDGHAKGDRCISGGRYGRLKLKWSCQVNWRIGNWKLRRRPRWRLTLQFGRWWSGFRRIDGNDIL